MVVNSDFPVLCGETSASGELAEIKSPIQGFKLSAQSVGKKFFIVFLNKSFVYFMAGQIWLKIRFKI